MSHSHQSAELLAPAGEPDAAYAAFQYGADAIYIGLHKFSARAEAVNASAEELDRIVSYAHSLTPRRKVFVTVNTLILDHELDEMIGALGSIAEMGVDAAIVQDLGVYRLLHEHFPEIPLHASTQMSIHNLEGALALKALGFSRVTLARELTLDDIRHIATACGIETEVFIHGALCYAYSGLCLFSSQFRNRSGNRGKCTYPCRDCFETTGAPGTMADGKSVKRPPSSGLPFSMKDLSLTEDLPALCDAGVTSFKIEGRKKSPLYVAAATDLYRRILDGRLGDEEKAQRQADLQTIFSRPLTRLYIPSAHHTNVADPDTVGHRGTPVGKVERIIRSAKGPALLHFKTRRALEKHDGLQIDLPGEERPFGFAIDRLYDRTDKRSESERDVFEAPADAIVEVELPPGYPFLPPGAKIYCSSSQAVKRSFPFDRARPGEFRTRFPVSIRATLTPSALTVEAGCPYPFATEPLKVEVRRQDIFQAAKDPTRTAAAVRQAFEKLGDTRFFLDRCEVADEQHVFAPVSILNQMRREMAALLDTQVNDTFENHLRQITTEALAPFTAVEPMGKPAWSIKVDRISYLNDFSADEFNALHEAIVDVAMTPLKELTEELQQLTSRCDAQKIRLALPMITRAWEQDELREKISALRERGWTRWEAANLSAWTFLGVDPHTGQPDHYPLDLAADWPVHVLNRLAAGQILEMGASRVTLSPEDGTENQIELLRQLGEKASVILYQDSPLFISESCAYANLIGGCPGKNQCQFVQMEMKSDKGDSVIAIDRHCRTYTISRKSFCAISRLGDFHDAGARHFRADFIVKPYLATDVAAIWRKLLDGLTPSEILPPKRGLE
ncbi:MAG: DUF3656 domain-containing protein [Lentisphaerota bacterium]